MGWRILLPIFGSAGIIYSVAGASTSDQRSEQPASTKPTHKWEVEVDKLSVELTCSGNYDGKVQQATFKWQVSLTEGDKEQLLRGNGVDKEAQVTFILDGNKNLWPNSLGGIKVDTTKYGNSLSVKSYYPKNPSGSTRDTVGRSIGISHASYDQSTFSCTWMGLEKNTKEEEVYRSGMLRGQSELFATSRSSGLKVNISPTNVCTVEGGKKTQCDLKVTTKEAHLDWSEKVSAKLRLELK